ncbi:hypothetical protein V8G54_031147 [Vigna mungo]|uniref:Uncharacterized protein n=1 Tax=Vigna mungo TaxID=3915 RepID=A0AAQ3RLX0_VIGMU
MDGRMTKAAATGNVDELERLMREDMLVLDRIALLGAETPLHIASMRGHVSFVQKMLELKKQFVYELNQDGFSPMHLASANGHELLSFAPLTVQAKTSRGETPLHIAVKSNQFDAVKFLVKHAKALNMEREVLNDKDNQANTVLHIAASRKQYQIVDMLLVAKKVMVVNSVNEREMTPLDVLSLFQSEAGDLEIYRSLVKAGAKSGKDIENENEAGRIR